MSWKSLLLVTMGIRSGIKFHKCSILLQPAYSATIACKLHDAFVKRTQSPQVISSSNLPSAHLHPQSEIARMIRRGRRCRSARTGQAGTALGHVVLRASAGLARSGSVEVVGSPERRCPARLRIACSLMLAMSRAPPAVADTRMRCASFAFNEARYSSLLRSTPEKVQLLPCCFERHRQRVQFIWPKKF